MHRFLGFTLAMIFVACGAATEPTRDGDGRAVFVGGLSGTDAAIALVERADRFIFYSCGGDTTFHSLTMWLDGATAPEQTLSAANYGFSLEATFDGDSADGTFTSPTGEARTFSARTVADTAQQGLLRATGTACNTGAIVRRGVDGEATFQGVGCDPSGAPKQVTPVGPIGAIDQGVDVVVDGSRMRLEPARPE